MAQAKFGQPNIIQLLVLLHKLIQSRRREKQAAPLQGHRVTSCCLVWHSKGRTSYLLQSCFAPANVLANLDTFEVALTLKLCFTEVSMGLAQGCKHFAVQQLLCWQSSDEQFLQP